PHVACRKELVNARAVVLVVRRDIGGTASIDHRPEPVAEFAKHTIAPRPCKTDGDKDEIGGNDEVCTRDRPALLVDLAAPDAREAVVLAQEFQCRHLELALRTFCLRGRGAHLRRPVGPYGELVFLFRRLRAYVEL